MDFGVGWGATRDIMGAVIGDHGRVLSFPRQSGRARRPSLGEVIGRLSLINTLHCFYLGICTRHNVGMNVVTNGGQVPSLHSTRPFSSAIFQAEMPLLSESGAHIENSSCRPKRPVRTTLNISPCQPTSNSVLPAAAYPRSTQAAQPSPEVPHEARRRHNLGLV